MLKVLKKAVRLAGRVWLALGALALLVAVCFLAIKIPYERLYEQPTFWAKEDLDDGPHIFWIDHDDAARIVSVRGDRATRDFSVTERLVGAREAEAEIVRLGCTPAPAQPPFASFEFAARKVAVVGDPHGRFNRLAAVLRQGGVTDSRSNWAWDDNHLVVVGDVFDKGPSVTRCLWFIRKLEAQAEKAGGRVHLVLGNHDYLALKGLSQTFGPKYHHVTSELGVSYAQLFGPDTELGRWVRGRNLALKINDTLFVHAGLSDAFLDQAFPLGAINRLARLSLCSPHRMGLAPEDRKRAAALWSREGPVYYRGYFDRSLPIGFFRALTGDLREVDGRERQIDRALRFYGCRRIVVGHTEGNQIKALYGGKLITTCLELPTWDAGEDLWGELLVLEEGKAFRVTSDGITRGL